MNSYFVPVVKQDIFFFTKEMVDEYMAEALEYCSRGLDKPANGEEGADGYALAWDNASKINT